MEWAKEEKKSRKRRRIGSRWADHISFSSSFFFSLLRYPKWGYISSETSACVLHSTVYMVALKREHPRSGWLFPMHCGSKQYEIETLNHTLFHELGSEQSEQVSKRANESVQRSLRVKRAGRRKQISKRCKQTSEWTREWPVPTS